MLMLVSGATKTVDKYRENIYIGALLTPRAGNSEKSRKNLIWAADNSAFSNFDEKKFVNMLEKIKGTDCKFVSCPDVVGNGLKTLELFEKWNEVIRSYNLPVAIVLQNGMNVENVPFEKCDAVFIGGDNEFKLGNDAKQIVKKAKLLNKWVHMGRVNTLKRIRYAFEIGCDSFDGSGFSMFPDTHIPKALKFLEELHHQKTLF